MFSVKSFLTCLGGLLVFSLPAHAAGKADIRPVFKPDGVFGFCLADIPYEDGRRLSVAVSPKEELNIGLMIPGGGFETRAQYDLTLILMNEKAADGAPTFDRSVRAIGMDKHSLLLQMSTNAAFVSALSDSDLLIAKAGGKALDFPLPAMRPLLKELKSCNKKNRGAKPSAEVKKDKGSQDEIMPEDVKALLLEAGLQGVSPLRMDGVPEEQRPADILWKTGNLIGGLRERIVPKDMDLTKLIGLHMQGLKKNCSGAFRTEVGREEKASGLVLRVAGVECQMKEVKGGKNIAVYSAILFYLTPAHRFTFFTHEGVLADKVAAMEARDALKGVILRLAGGNGG